MRRLHEIARGVGYKHCILPGIDFYVSINGFALFYK